ncbi:MAG: ROK family transcriptional regulator [Geminicoccaceae bacterium]|nr:ROK family transcriptional regulator [Geminicoccaceae bacterium]
MTASARAVFRELARSGAATRPQLGDILRLSRPTMSAAIAELNGLGFVRVHGEVQGALGRKAQEYSLGPGAGHVIAVDAGSTKIQLRVSTLDRHLLSNREYSLPSSHLVLNEAISDAVAQEVDAARRAWTPAWGPLRAIGIAIPARVADERGDGSLTGENVIFSRFQPPDDISIILENNVNCAAVAEQLYGAAQGHETFAYVQIGLKIGMGLMLNGTLLRGRNGAAGEIGHLAFPWAPGIPPEPGAAERHVGSEALMERVRAAWPAADARMPADTDELLVRAGEGHAVALEQLERHARDVGVVVASIVSVVDPGLVVLGGGLGASNLLTGTVSQVANHLSYSVDVCNTMLGRDATVLGIEKRTIDTAILAIIGLS